MTRQLIGEKIGNYLVKSVLGRGSMGIVYLGVNPHMGKKVAIKILAAHLMEEDSMVNRFMLEAKALNSLNHPNIVKIFDLGFLPDNRCYYIMEHLEGKSLSQSMRKEGMTVANIDHIFEGVCNALEEVHKNGILHRDLKPGNIFMSKEKDGSTTVKIVDFGIAKLLVANSDLTNVLTTTGTVLGTPVYMSPEQSMGQNEELTASADTYSLGVIVYKMLSDTVPVKGNGIGEIVASHLLHTPKQVRAHNIEVTEELNAFVMKAIAKEPKERFQSAIEFYQALKKGLSTMDPSIILTPRFQDNFTVPSVEIKYEAAVAESSTPGSLGGQELSGPVSSESDCTSPVFEITAQPVTQNNPMEKADGSIVPIKETNDDPGATRDFKSSAIEKAMMEGSSVIVSSGQVEISSLEKKGLKLWKIAIPLVTILFVSVIWFTQKGSKSTSNSSTKNDKTLEGNIKNTPDVAVVKKLPSLLVKSNPLNIRVTGNQDGESKISKVTPFRLNVVSGNSITLKVEHAGYRPYIETFTITKSATHIIKLVSLPKLPVIKPLAKKVVPRKKKRIIKRRHQKVSKPKPSNQIEKGKFGNTLL
jgi:serine/threonine protein kinase